MKKLILLFSILFSLSANAQQYPIIIEIPDVIVDGTVLKRKASLFTMTYNIGRQYVALNWEVSYWAAKEDSTYGLELTFIPKYTKENLADNTTNVAENVPVIVNDVIRQYGQNTKW